MLRLHLLPVSSSEIHSMYALNHLIKLWLLSFLIITPFFGHTTMAAFQTAHVDADGVSIFYRYAGDPKAPTILLLHGYPSSSFQYRNLIPLLATRYRVIAPDLPGFGFTDVPAARNYTYTFANLATTIGHFLDALDVKRFAVYIFDYGAPTAFRLALERPDSVTAIISQNGNAYNEGLGPFWDTLRPLWADNTDANRAAAAAFVRDPATTKAQYSAGFPDGGAAVPPETYTLDFALLQRPGNVDIQVALFYDYRTNVEAYPTWQKWLREKQPPVLAAWGKNDNIFVPPGVEAFKRDVPGAEVHLLDTGHFALEGYEKAFAALILEFLKRKGIY